MQLRIFRVYVYCFTLISFFLMFSSCITNRDMEYLRNSKEITIDYKNYEYQLQEGDLISIQVSTRTQQQHDFFNKEETSNSQLMVHNPYLYGYIIKEGGMLELPTVGEVKASGFTLRELESIIQQIMVPYFETPVVKLNIINFEISVLGEVNSPGSFKIVKPNPDLLYAISIASGFTSLANRKRVKIIRTNYNQKRIFFLDLTDSSVLQNPDFYIHPNDVIYIEPLNKRFYAFNNLPALLSMAVSSITLYFLIRN